MGEDTVECFRLEASGPLKDHVSCFLCVKLFKIKAPSTIMLPVLSLVIDGLYSFQVALLNIFNTFLIFFF